jgi:hypothetical protein
MQPRFWRFAFFSALAMMIAGCTAHRLAKTTPPAQPWGNIRLRVFVAKDEKGPLTDTGVVRASALPALDELGRRWMIGPVGLHDHELPILFPAGDFNRLRSLDVSGTGISDGFVASLAHLPDLEELSIDDTMVGNSGLALLVVKSWRALLGRARSTRGTRPEGGLRKHLRSARGRHCWPSLYRGCRTGPWPPASSRDAC